MTELAQILLIEPIDEQISVLEKVKLENQKFLEEASKNKSTLQSVVKERMKLAKEQNDLLQYLERKKEEFKNKYGIKE